MDRNGWTSIIISSAATMARAAITGDVYVQILRQPFLVKVWFQLSENELCYRWQLPRSVCAMLRYLFLHYNTTQYFPVLKAIPTAWSLRLARGWDLLTDK